MLSPLEVVQRQFDAYNRRNLEDFLANFSENIKVFRPPSPEPAIVGKRQLAEFYAKERFNRDALRAELVSRTVLGNKVFDFERIWGVRETPFEMMAVFEVQDGAIQTIWGFVAD
ncbi:nuclear transport factor 2 family protein [Pendulispora brunnea]|uniref:Nuclear transport factor 2 family protein n=1 Tax=Pendulispora brunnea TaxID=2905690 RepID=A0ABZ2K683_9BACT